MRETWIVPSKLTPATPPPGWLYREGLPAGNALPPISLLVAGPGYGKTLALVALTMRAQHAGKAVLYYSLDLYDADPATFFHYLVAGMQAHIPQFGEEVKALLVGEKLDPRLLWQRFFQSIASYNLPGLLIVFDDFQHLFETQPELIKAFTYFWDKLPPRTHLAIASRHRLPVGVSKFEAKGLLRRFEEPELRFTPQEQEAFLMRRAGESPVPEAWRKQLDGLDGWPLGLDIVTTVAPERASRLERGSEKLMEYVAEEFYEAQPDDRRPFMLKAAILQELTPEACRWVFQANDANEQLEALEALHLVQRLAEGVGYRFSPYLRDFLLAEAERTHSGLELADWHRRAAHYYQERHQHELALPHLIASQAWDDAAAACEASFPAMRFSGRQSLIGRWLGAFAPEVAESEPVIQLWWGHHHSRAGRMGEAAPYYDRARALFEQRGDEAGVFKVLVRQVTLALLQEDMKLFSSLLMRAQSLQAAGRDEDVVDLCLTRALAAEQRGDLALMEECNESALALPVGDNVEIAASHCIARLNLFTLEMHRGRLGKSHNHIAQAIELAERWKFYPYHLFASFMQAHLRLLEDDVEGAGAFLRHLPPHWSDLLDWHDLACAYTTLGYYHQAKGEWKEAEEALQKSVATFDKAGFKEGIKVPLERMLWGVVGRRQYPRAPELIAEAGEITPRNVYHLALMVPHARALHLMGQTAPALAALETTVPALEELGADLHLARALLVEGACRFGAGDAETAEARVTRALALAEARDYRFLPAQDPQLWEELAPLVTSRRIHVPFVEQALSAAAGFEVTLTVEAAPEAPAKPAKPKAKPVPAAPARAPHLSLRCFGGMEVRAEGVLLDQWPRRKAKIILAGLALYPRGLTLVQLAEFLGIHEVTPGALTTLKVDVSALRRSLEPSLGKNAPSAYVINEDDRYVLAWDRVDYCDLLAFEQEMAKADSLVHLNPLEALTAYEGALGHFRGNLLEDAVFRGVFDAEREQYRQRAVSALVWMAEFQIARGELLRADATLQRAVEVAPCEEDTYVALMKLQKALGRPERIRQVYWDCRKALKAHLGMTPSDEFETAYKQVAGA